MTATKGRSNIKTRFYMSAGIFVKWLHWKFNITVSITSRLCFLSEVDAAVDNYVPMYGSTTRGQEDIALLTINSADMESFEGKNKHLKSENACCQTEVNEHLQLNTSEPCWS